MDGGDSGKESKMAWRPKGKLTIKAAKDFKAGDDIEVVGEFEVDQSDLDRMTAERLSREAEKRTELETRATKAEAEAKRLADEAQKKATPDEAARKASEETAARLKAAEENTESLRKQLKAKELIERTDRVIQSKNLRLPAAYRGRIEVKDDATDAQIEQAVQVQAEQLKADLVALGVKEGEGTGSQQQSTTTDGSFGFRGNGSTAAPKVDRAKGQAALAKARQNRPDLLKFVAGKNDEQLEAAALNWDSKGQLEPAVAKK